MNPTHLHLLRNQAPFLGAVFGLGLLLFGLWRKSGEVKKTALSVFVVVALLVVLVSLTGAPVAAGLKGLPRGADPAMELRAKVAIVAFLGALVLGVASIAGLVLFRRGKLVPAWFAPIMLTTSLVVSGLMAWTANGSGPIQPSGIRPPARPIATTAAKDNNYENKALDQAPK